MALALLLLPSLSLADSREFRLYASQTSGSYTYGSDYAVATLAWPTSTFEITYTIPSAGTWYFVLTAYRENAPESDPSNEVSGTFSEDEQVTFRFDGYHGYRWAGLTHPMETTLKPAATGSAHVNTQTTRHVKMVPRKKEN